MFDRDEKGSTDELEVTMKPAMTGRHALEIRILAGKSGCQQRI